MKRAVITGPTGAIGTALIAELISHGIEVEAVVRPDSRRTDNIPKSPLVHIVPCDLKELKTLHEKIEHADVFYHFGWDGTFGNSRNNAYGQLENVRYALDAVEAAAALGCLDYMTIESTDYKSAHLELVTTNKDKNILQTILEAFK